MKFYLVHTGSEELEITGECQIGRRNGDLKFGDELLSGTHAKLITDGEKLYITDLGSSNGTFVNKKKIEALVPFEVFDGDLIEMGGQKMNVKCHNSEATRIEESAVPAAAGESTRIEESFAVSEGTNVEAMLPSIAAISEESPVLEEEAPALALIREEEPVIEAPGIALEAAPPIIEEDIAPLIEEAVPPIAKSEATHIEVAPPAEPEAPALALRSEATHIELPEAPAALEAVSSAEATHDEIIPSAEGTHVEAPAFEAAEKTHVENAKASSPHLKIIEAAHAESDNFVRPAKINHEAPRVSPAASVALDQIEVEATSPPSNAIVAVAHDIHNLFGTKTLVIACAVIIGVFAFLLTGRKNVNRAVAQVEESQTQETQAVPEVTQVAVVAPAPIPDPAADIAAQAASASAASLEAANAAAIAAVVSAAREANAITTAAAAASQEPVAETKVEEAKAVEVPKKKKVAKKVVKKPAAKVAKKSTTTTTAIKSTKKDPYAEAILLKELSKIREEAKRSSSQRVKSALEVDAAEITAAHYKKFKTAILLKWKSGRSIASTKERNKIKKTLQGQLVALNTREKIVKAKVASYVNGKIKSPF